MNSGVPRGTEEKISGIKCYVSKPEKFEETDTVILLVSDVFKFELLNARLVADLYAAKFVHRNGKVVYPDLFNGRGVTGDLAPKMMRLVSNQAGFFEKISIYTSLLYHGIPFFINNPTSKSSKVLTEVIKGIKADPNIKHIMLCGYCYGGGVAMKLSGPEGKALGIDIVSCIHGPISVPKDIVNVEVNLAVITAEKDMQPTDTKQVEALMSKKAPAISCMTKHYPAQCHGFALRGDDTDDEVRRDKIDVIDVTFQFLLDIISENTK